MTLKELVQDLRTRLLDDTGGEGVDWTDDAVSRLLRWSNQELVDVINEAMRETARRVKSITDNLTINVVAGQDTYDLDPVAFKLRRVKLTSTPNVRLEEVSWKDLDALHPDWETQINTPTSYILDWEDGKIRIFPTPLIDDTLELNVYRYPNDDMDYSNWDSDEPELRTEYQRNALYWAAKLAYEKDENNSLDSKRAREMEVIYTGHFGMPESAYAIMRKKRAKRQISYGGIRQDKNNSVTGYWTK